MRTVTAGARPHGSGYVRNSTSHEPDTGPARCGSLAVRGRVPDSHGPGRSVQRLLMSARSVLQHSRKGTAMNGTSASTVLALASLAAMLAHAVPAAAQNDASKTRVQAGVLTCEGEGGWGLIITSKKTFRCTFSSSNGEVREAYRGAIRKIGVDVGKTGATSLLWFVFGPGEKVGERFVPGSLQGRYVGAGAEASVVVGLGANALVGGGADSFALQPVSVQVQTGLSIAAGVQSLGLEYVGPVPGEPVKIQ